MEGCRLQFITASLIIFSDWLSGRNKKTCEHIQKSKTKQQNPSGKHLKKSIGSTEQFGILKYKFGERTPEKPISEYAALI